MKTVYKYNGNVRDIFGIGGSQIACRCCFDYWLFAAVDALLRLIFAGIGALRTSYTYDKVGNFHSIRRTNLKFYQALSTLDEIMTAMDAVGLELSPADIPLEVLNINLYDIVMTYTAVATYDLYSDILGLKLIATVNLFMSNREIKAHGVPLPDYPQFNKWLNENIAAPSLESEA